MTPNPPKFTSYKLPTVMAQRIKMIIEKHPECGWKGVSSFVQDAVRHHPYWKKHSLDSS